MKRLKAPLHFPALALLVAACASPTPEAGTCQPNRLVLDGLLSIDAQSCQSPHGPIRVERDIALPGLWLSGAGDRRVVLQVFNRPPGPEGAQEVLKQLAREGRIPADGLCVFSPAAPRPAVRTTAFYEIRPTGARLAALEATPKDEIPDPPCGDFGWSTHGQRYFMHDLRRPDLMIYIDEGQDGSQIDPRSIQLRQDGEAAPSKSPNPEAH